MGGSKTVFGEGLYGMFSPPLSSPPPFVLFFAGKTQRAQGSKKIEISSENEIFERAIHRGPIFCGEIETSRLKFSSETKKFDRD